MKIALVYDRVNKWGGAERVLLALKELFPDAPLYTSVYNSKKAQWAKIFKITTSFLQHIPFTSSRHEAMPYLMPQAFESFTFDEYDVVISVTSESAKGIVTKPETLHICYCLTPTRYLWSGYDEYFSNNFFRFFTKPIVTYLQKWDLIAAERPDVMIAISDEVKGRIKKFYQRDVEVIYPPLTLDVIKRSETIPSRTNYFLVVSRLVPYKRIDLAIRACNKLKLPLVIIGSGSEEKKLCKLAGPTVTFMKNLTDEELVTYYKNCIALIFPGREDFGLSIIETESFGKPVVAYKGGGAVETIVEGVTGEFFYPQTSAALAEKLQFLLKKCIVSDINQKTGYSQDAIVKQAAKFSKEQFRERILTLVTSSLSKHSGK